MTEALDAVAVAQAPEPKVRYELAHGDALDVLKHLPDACCDSLVCDPPAGIGFMGKKWDEPGALVERRADTSVRFDKVGGNHNPENNADKVRTNRVQGVKFRATLTPIFREALRVLKPGAHGLVWALPRTSHWTATALEDAGFEIRDVVTHLFGTGFPKSLDVSKAIDKAAGAKREVIGPGTRHGGGTNNVYSQSTWTKEHHGDVAPSTAPATDAAKQWSGWGTALKPSSEHWILIRKPLGGTVASNVIAHGTGGINIDGCRISTGENLNGGAYAARGGRTDLPGAERSAAAAGMLAPGKTVGRDLQQPPGRWPANTVLSHNDDCVVVGKRKVKSGVAGTAGRHGFGTAYVAGDHKKGTRLEPQTFADADGNEEIDAYECTPGCAVAMLDTQSGELKSGVLKAGTIAAAEQCDILGARSPYIKQRTSGGDSGGASRFFYVAKASKKDRSGGLPEGKENKHPTVKNTSLMDWLIRLITPPGGVVLDCFMGSGSTGVAALLAGFRFFGIERELESFEVATHRIEEAAK